MYRIYVVMMGRKSPLLRTGQMHQRSVVAAGPGWLVDGSRENCLLSLSRSVCLFANVAKKRLFVAEGPPLSASNLGCCWHSNEGKKC